MAKCEVCGNNQGATFEIIQAGKRHVFDSFECAIHAIAPICAHCSCHVVGHAVEAKGELYCSAHCAALGAA